MAGQQDLQHRKAGTNLLLGVLLQFLLPHFRPGEPPQQALAQMVGVVEVWQAEEGDLHPNQDEQDGEDLIHEDSSPLGNGRALHFQPSQLDFGTQPVGVPRVEVVNLLNPSHDLPLTLISLFTSSTHFYMPSFHSRVIPPRGKSSFKVIFLPTKEGSVENVLFINTSSHGIISYQLFGAGISLGSSGVPLKIPSTFIFPDIHILRSKTQEEALNSSRLWLQLECNIPKRGVHYSQDSCFVEEENLLVQVHLFDKNRRNEGFEKLEHYINENVFVLFVLKGNNIIEEPKITIYLLNSGARLLQAKEIKLVSQSKGLFEIEQSLLRPSASKFTQIASLVCRATQTPSGREKKGSGEMTMRVLKGSSTLKSYPSLHLSYRSFEHEAAPTLFDLKNKDAEEDLIDIWLTNGFDFSFTLDKVQFPKEADKFLKVLNFSSPVLVPPGCWKMFTLQYVNRIDFASVVANIILVTSHGFSLEMPLQIKSTMLKVSKNKRYCDNSYRLRLLDAASAEWQESLLLDSSTWRVDKRLATELWSKDKDQKTFSCPKLLKDPGLTVDFKATSVNESKVKYFTLKNPVDAPVTVQLLPVSSYPEPHEALNALIKWFNLPSLDINISTSEFMLMMHTHEDDINITNHSKSTVVNLHLAPKELKKIAVAFTPVDKKCVTSVILIRNNLTVFDIVLVKGCGTKEILKIGGRLPGTGASLRFNVPQSTLMQCRNGLKSSKPFVVQKTFTLENAGELPLTITSMSISGYKCQGFGFEILGCRILPLDYNSTQEISIVFTPDFTTSWIIRDLTLVTARGSSFIFTLNVTLPHHMLPLCAQFLPGPSWEEKFWIVVIVFTWLSLGGVCLMAFHQAQCILIDFSIPVLRQNNNSGLPRESSHVDTVTSTSARGKGSCKTFTDSGNTPDKGKGKGSLSVTSGNCRTQTSSKKSPGTFAQSQKKYKVSLYYSKYKVNPTSSAIAAASSMSSQDEECLPVKEPYNQGDHIDENTNKICAIENKNTVLQESEVHSRHGVSLAVKDCRNINTDMFPMETNIKPSEELSVATNNSPNHWPCSSVEKKDSDQVSDDQQCSTFLPFPEKKIVEKRDIGVGKVKEDCNTNKMQEKADINNTTSNAKGRRGSVKNRRRIAGGIMGLTEQNISDFSDKSRDAVNKETKNPNRSRNRCTNGKQESVKLCGKVDSPLKHLQNRTSMANPRRSCNARRLFSDSSSDSGSSSGSVRDSRGSWGSWSSASSLEGEKDHSTTKLNCISSTTKRDDHVFAFLPDKECCQPLNSSYRIQSVHNLNQGEKCHIPESVPTLSFASVASGVERNMTLGPCQSEEIWSPMPTALTNGFRYNTSENMSFIPPENAGAIYSHFPWTTSQYAAPYHYSDQNGHCVAYEGNMNFQNAFQEVQNVQYTPQAFWNEESPPDLATSWDSNDCIGSKAYFSGTRSLSPMSSLFGSIWTPQSDPYQSHFQHNMRSVPHSSHPTFSREQSIHCRQKQYSGFDPFGCHMNLDIWNSSSNQGSNSQLSNDSGYCGEA
ncbi:transmembrane protein 131-like [Polypterus senegalus]|uniref:transmembrane protein 131-like n=1 Tax=Polypterus senegalus TaxID=55291 RepID=UPI0019635FDA|nr:transmembrane protein 131-like [Polypterus senegalus]